MVTMLLQYDDHNHDLVKNTLMSAKFEKKYGSHVLHEEVDHVLLGHAYSLLEKLGRRLALMRRSNTTYILVRRGI
jgi:hypothetical protein